MFQSQLSRNTFLSFVKKEEKEEKIGYHRIVQVNLFVCLLCRTPSTICQRWNHFINLCITHACIPTMWISRISFVFVHVGVLVMLSNLVYFQHIFFRYFNFSLFPQLLVVYAYHYHRYYVLLSHCCLLFILDLCTWITRQQLTDEPRTIK